MWVSVLYLITTVLLAYGLRHVLLREARKLHGVYSEPDVWFVYWVRWLCKVVEVWALQVSRRRRVNNYDITGTSYELCGIEATPSEKELEQPKPLITDRHEDSMLIWGADEAGRGVVARVVRQTQRRASVLLTVVDQTGDVYTLPNQPDSNLVNVTGGGWRGGGLSLQCVDPMRCWRLKFNGLLRRGPREEYITDDEDDTDDSEVIHARLDLLWRAARCPVDVFNDASPLLLAHALAREPAASVKLFTSLERDGYDQWGALHGMVTLKDNSEEWYLRGCRQHRWGISETVANFYRSVDIFSYFHNGEVCSLQAISYTSGLSHYVVGYVQEASGRYRPVTSTTLSLPDLAEKAPIPKNILTRFTTSSGKYDLWHKLGPKVTHYTGDPWSLCHVLNFNSVAINHSFGYGITLFSDRFKGLCPVPERECLPALVEPRVEIDEATTPLVLPLIDQRTRATCLTGGKASSLAFLMSLKDITDDEYEVPDGVVVTVAAWRQQLKAFPELQTAVRGVEKAVGCSQQAQLKDACARAVESFKSTPVCPKVEEALRQTLEETFEQNCQSRRFAVRSSGCSEDGEETSAAGQNETQLGVVGVENLLRALAACWASLFTFQSVEYRRQHGQAVDGGMGVVVQEMVEADAAGVLFSLDPVTGSPASITITANYGLGESVVSAAAEPDTVTVTRSWRNQLTMASRTVGAKKVKCVMKEGGGTLEEEVPSRERERVCLSDAQAMKLARLAVFLERAFGSPRDVEFAVTKDALYLLQARPITTLESWTDFEILHEQDNALLTDHELLTKANVGEVLYGRISPLTLSIMPSVLDTVFQRENLRCIWPAIPFDPHHVKLCPTFASQFFLNMIEMQYHHNQGNEVNATNQAIDLAVHGYEVTTPQFLSWGIERYGIMTRMTFLQVMFNLIYDKFCNGGRVSNCRQKFGDYNLDQGRRTLSPETLYSDITRHLPDLVEAGHNHVLTSKFSSSSQCIALQMLAEDNKELSEDNRTDIAVLLSSCTGIESADVPTALKALARVIAENEELDDFLGMADDEAQVWLESDPGLVGSAFRAFLAKHGHRCVKELDLHSVSWGMDPHTLVQTLQVMVRNPSSYTSVKKVTSIDQALDSIRSQVKPKTRRSLKFVLPMCREAVVNREATKSLIVKILDGLRKAYRRSLKFVLPMCREGRREPRGHEVSDSEDPRRTKESVQISASQALSVSPDGSELVLQGTPVCQGLVTAPARVVTDLKDAVNIQNGDILVTHSTDVGWTPFFPLLSGVVTEIGGLVSHGAVVAREYGLPCAVGVTSATSILRSGDTIILNATKGTVTRLEVKATSGD
ncbi:putative phosphoenolpyruvate synthase [Penaeus indicus]|uniref:putative phosphoenolpyruvate synthase n=1 Tax=Penaeus indicus TaxID=29960 RepID=UPI00300DB1F1